MKTPTLLVLATWSIAGALFAPAVQAQPLVTIETVIVGDPGNAPDTTGFGAVPDTFFLGKYEVSISQYTTFLNTVAAVTTDAYLVDLWNPSMATDLNIAGISRSGSGTSGDPYSYSTIGNGGRPIAYVSWFDAARFANWVNNGATNGASTETGAYTLNGAVSGIYVVNPGASWYLPNESQWYKAAYYKAGGTNAGYYLYPTKNDNTPGNLIGANPNQANYFNIFYSATGLPFYSSSANYLSVTGAFTASPSEWGTFDQGGNLAEWNDAAFETSRGLRGGAWTNGALSLQSSDRGLVDPLTESATIGFRLANVPEPSTWALLLAAGALFAARCRAASR